VDTHAPVVSNVTASQDASADTFTFHYDVSEDAGNATIVLAISSDGGSTWIVPITSAVGDVGSVVPGAGKTITWNGATDYNNQEKNNLQIRITATDQFSNNSNLASANFSLDTKAPRVTSVSAVETLGGTNVVVTYTLADQNNSLIEMDISADGGTNWNVISTSVSGDVGTGVTGGSKTITWNAKTDYPNQTLNTMKVRVRGRDIFNNQSANTNSSNFSLDTLNPAVNVTADLQTQPNAGDTTALIGGSFTEVNPGTNVFYLDLNGGGYGNGTTGTANTASPSNQATIVGATLDGNDYISKVKITHTDDYGQTVDNENTLPATSYKYVKPHTPSAPTADNPGVGTVDVTVNKNPAETDGLEYAIYETSQDKYVQANGTLGATAVWQSLGTGVGQWGNSSGISGKINVNGLATHSYLYQFKVKSRNTSDISHAPSSESALSNGASSQNQSPRITINTTNQTTDGSKYVSISYDGYDLEAENVNLTSYQYSTNGTTWVTMTEKTGVGSDGKTNLSFGNSGNGNLHDFMWDVGSDLPNTQDDTVYVRLQGNDGTSSGNLEVSSAFIVDTKAPVVASVVGLQVTGSDNVTITYNLTDVSNSSVELQISDDAGATWNIATSSVSGDIGGGVIPGNGKSITWNAGVDFTNQEQSDLRARVRAVDSFGNAGTFTSSSNFSLDTKAPTVSNVVAVQNLGANTVAVTYTLADANNSTVAIDISEDNGLTWGVIDTSVTGDIGPNVTPGNKTFTWDAAADFPNRDQGNMKIRVRATDVYSNASGNIESAAFNVDTKAPVVTNVSGSQLSSSRLVSINYDLTDSSLVNIQIDLSNDGGVTWTVTDTSVTGDIGSGITQGNNKVIIWNAGTDFNNQDQNDMRVRVRGLDPYNNSSGNIESANFSVDTKAPVIATAADLTAQPNAGDSTVTILAAFTESNPKTNEFLVAINGGAYSATTTGDSNTASPSVQATGVGAVLNGNDYISKVKVLETDDYNQSVLSENTSPAVAYKYVKPYTPPAPTVNNPQNTAVDVTINIATGEASNLQYAIYEASTNRFVQDNGSLGVTAVWQTLGTGAGQWGNLSGTSGKISVTGLTTPVANYNFKVKSRNPSDSGHAVTSESNLSSSSAISNTAPTIAIVSAAQQAGTNYVLINYTGTDLQNDTNNLSAYEYSTDNVTWATMTEKTTGAGSNGVSGLIFASTGSSFIFAWDVGTDLPNTEDATVYVRLKSTDTLVDSNLAVSSALAIDTLGPVVSNINVSQNPNSSFVNVGYNLADNSGGSITVELLISDDNGATYTVATSTLAGDIGGGVSAGVSKAITWDTSVNFSGQEQSSMKLKIRGRDTYGNLGNFTESSSFVADNKAPVVSSVTASQTAGSSNVSVNYTLADLSSSGNLVEFGVSSDGGATWTVATTSVSGEVGTGQTTGSKTFVWNAGTDFTDQYQTDIKVRVRAKDYFGNQGSFVSSANFILDTLGPVVTNVAAVQTAATENFVITYDLAENSGASNVDLQISSDGGATWTVTSASVTGDVGAGITAGANKTITWNAGADFNGQEQTDMRVRIRGKDSFNNQGSYFSSTDFALDTGAPVGLASLSKFSSTTSTVTLTWANGVTDANFDHYELWYGSVENDVVNATGTASRWSTSNDANLSNILTNTTVITGLNVTDNFYVKIFAVDNYNNISTTAHINIFSAAPTPEPAPTPVIIPATGGGGAPAPIVPIKLSKPILTPLESPTRSTQVVIRGVAPSRSRIDLYDNGIFVARLISVSSNDGIFSQPFTFNTGNHSLVVVAVDFNNNSSDPSGPVNLNITTLAPAAPLIFSPKNNDAISGNEVVIVGGAVPSGVVDVTLGGATYSAPVNTDGAWQLVLPNVNQLSNGFHALTIRATDLAGNISPNTTLTLNKVAQIIPAVTAPGVTLLPGAVGGASGALTGPAALAPITLTELPIPPVKLIEETAGAVELAALPVPNVSNVQFTVSANQPNLIAFAGTALPNQDVLVYIHSDQALIYRTRANNVGAWSFAHDQNVTELTPGEHSIYAVAVDTNAQVKSRPSAVSFFTVKKSLWVTIFNLLNLPTTIVTVIILSITIFWLYRLKKKGALAA
ncbi:MAG: Ig-like domain-containing protein, partial [Candidatus Magasanikbacteria bacterium]|nr:Ig-like domain-containing protein [Candidatus Magasanikbacteria bacterium]